jgi:lipopolysaccharide/colanic/teichoic acid biosynthesis glycosyltransferase
MNFFFKRLIDLIISIFVLIFFFPIIYIFVFSLFLCGHEKIFFKQKRYGLKKKIFTIYKFATIKNDKWNSKKKNTAYYKYGKLLRILKIDEIPNFFNVLINDMSLIGPRPTLIDYSDFRKSDRNFNKRFIVKPGLIGLCQIYKYDHKKEYLRKKIDFYYVENFSLLLDLKIFISFISLNKIKIKLK